MDFESGPVLLAEFVTCCVFSDGTSGCLRSCFCSILEGWLGMPCRQSADSAPQPRVSLCFLPHTEEPEGSFDTGTWTLITELVSWGLKHLVCVGLLTAVLLRSSLSHKWGNMRELSKQVSQLGAKKKKGVPELVFHKIMNSEGLHFLSKKQCLSSN